MCAPNCCSSPRSTPEAEGSGQPAIPRSHTSHWRCVGWPGDGRNHHARSLRSQRLLPPPRRANATLSPLSSPRRVEKSVKTTWLACLRGSGRSPFRISVLFFSFLFFSLLAGKAEVPRAHLGAAGDGPRVQRGTHLCCSCTANFRRCMADHKEQQPCPGLRHQRQVQGNDMGPSIPAAAALVTMAIERLSRSQRQRAHGKG